MFLEFFSTLFKFAKNSLMNFYFDDYLNLYDEYLKNEMVLNGFIVDLH